MADLDELPPVSITDKIAAKFGLPSQADERAGAEETEEVETTAETVEDDGFADLDWEGQTVKVPKGVKDALLRHDDYTRKTQELAESRRSVDQMRELAQTRQLESAFNESISAEQQEIHVIDAYLQQAGKQDWSAMSTDQIIRHKIDMDNIKERRALLADSINGKRSKFNDDMKAKIVELRGKSRELASKSIQGFTEDTEKSMRVYALSEGLTEAEIDNVLLDPRSYKVIYKAMQFDKIKAGSKSANQAERVLRPGAANEKMPSETAKNLNFHKAMKAAGNNSGKTAQVIEQRLAGVFKGHR